ncbi:MAG: hypothetical protein ACRC7N_20445 [Clostridium sp.]
MNELLIDFNKKLNELILKRELLVRYDELKSSFSKLIKEKRILSEKVEKEENDIKRLKGFSIEGVMLTLKGNKAERLEKEECEYNSIKLEYNEFILNYNNVRDEIEAIENSLKSLKNIEEEFKVALNTLMNYVVKYEDDSKYDDMKEIYDYIAYLKNERDEYGETITSGKDLLSDVSNILKSLGDADAFGTYDAWFGGGFIVSSMKHDYINDAKSAMKGMEKKLSCFLNKSKNLKNITFNMPREINMSNTTIMFDMCCDNIFTDFSVLGDIRSSKKKVVKFKNSILKALDIIEEKNSEILNLLDSLEIKLIKEISNVTFK